MKNSHRYIFKSSAYTLVELVVIIAVLGILVSMVVISYGSWNRSMAVASVKSDLSHVVSAMESYRNFNNTYPMDVMNLSNFESSPDVIISGGSADGKSYCVNGISENDSSVHYYITSDGGSATEGSCDSQSSPSKPSITFSLSGQTLQADLSTVACSIGTTQYSVRNRIEGGNWSNFTDWSTNRTYTRSVNSDSRYYYEAKSRCFVGENNFSSDSDVASASYVVPVPAPVAPVVTTNNFGDTTVWGWEGSKCQVGSSSYRYTYSTSPTIYNSGWISNGNQRVVSFTTSTIGQRYTVDVQQKCTGENSESSWSPTGSASFKKTIIAPLSAPTIAVTLSGANILATITPSTCKDGSAQYGIRSRTNDGSWSAYSDWSTALTATRVASDGVKYGYQARARCYVSAEEYSPSVESAESTYVKSITTPAAPSVAANTSGSTTTWSWAAVACSAGTINYQYWYSISPAGYNSGWINNGSTNSLTFTSNSPGQTYTVQVAARCAGTYTSSAWSGTGSASYRSPNVPTVANCAAASSITSASAILCANITADDGLGITDSGICWGTTPNPTGNCMSFYSSNLSSNGGGVSSASVRSLAVSLDGKNVYSTIAGSSSGSVIAYSRNQTTGALTSIGGVSGTPSYSVAVSPDGKNVYVGRGGSSIAVYSRDSNTGALSSLSSVSPGGTSIYAVAVSPDNKNVYAGSEGGTLYQLSRDASGNLTKVGSVSGTSMIYAVSVSFDGKNVYTGTEGGVRTYSRSSGGSIAYITRTSTTVSYSASLTPDGYALYSAYPGSSNAGATKTFSRNIGNGSLTYDGGVSACPKVYTAVSADGLSVYSASSCANNSGGLSVFSRGLTSSGLTATGGNVSSAPIRGVATSPDGKHVYSGVSTSSNSGGIIVYARNKNLGLGTFYQARAWMPSGTVIYFRGYATNSVGTGYAADGVFTTL